MDPNTFPTKGNLMRAKNSLVLARQGYGLMDKKRNILIRELMGLIDEAKGIQSEIDSTCLLYTSCRSCRKQSLRSMWFGCGQKRNMRAIRSGVQ